MTFSKHKARFSSGHEDSYVMNFILAAQPTKTHEGVE
jgi:hypothetical protein